MDPPQSVTPAISAILDSNDPPSELEACSIRDLLTAGRQHEARLYKEIASASAASREHLVAQRVALTRQIAEYEGALSLLRQMPTEILSLVFNFSILMDPNRSPFDDHALWILSQVCARWRTIMLPQPALWAVIKLDLYQLSDGCIFRLENQLQRSGQLPLKIDFTCSHWDEPCLEETQLLNMLVEHCLRWETFTLSFAFEGDDWNLGSIQGQLPLLRELDIQMEPPDEEEHRGASRSGGYLSYPIGSDYSFDYFQLAPNLRHVSINGGSNYNLKAKVPLPQLLRYRGNKIWGGHLATIHSARNLVDCALGLHSLTYPPPTRIPFPHLRRLAVRSSKFLDCLEAPALEELYCAGPTSPILHFLEAMPSSKLQKLFIHDCGSARLGPDFPSLLRAVPSLADLAVQFTDRDFARDLFSLLTIPPDGDAGELAHLESISICLQQLRYGSEPNPLQPFKEMVESRWRDGELQSVNLAASWLTRTWVVSLREEGLKFMLDRKTYTLLRDMVPLHLQLDYR
ncbi:hypothetical protein DFH09DRAFT_1273393 [Mycena vulgaris]|nr:hypothetical protein DFH09DRAFT_1273393 [Mycena vulgaris]